MRSCTAPGGFRSDTAVRSSGANRLSVRRVRSTPARPTLLLVIAIFATAEAAAQTPTRKPKNADLIDLVGLPPLPLPEVVAPARALPPPVQAAPSGNGADQSATGTVGGINRKAAPNSQDRYGKPVRVILPAPAPLAPKARSEMPSAPKGASGPVSETSAPDVLDLLQASLSGQPVAPRSEAIRLEVIAPVPPVRPDQWTSEARDIGTPTLAGVPAPPSRPRELAALGTVESTLSPGLTGSRPTVLPQASPPVAELPKKPALAPPPVVITRDESLPAARPPIVIPVRTVPEAPVHVASEGPVETTASVAPAMHRGEATEERSRRRAPSEWELPRAPRRSGRPALEKQASGTSAPALPTTRIAYIVRTQNLDQLVREIGQLADIRVVTGPGVRGTVRERKLEGPFNTVLDRLAREFNLFWFADGNTIYVDPLDEQKTKFFKVRGASQEHLYSALEVAGLGRHRDRIQLVGSDGLVRASGSEPFLRTVEASLTGAAGADGGTVQLIKFGQRAQ